MATYTATTINVGTGPNTLDGESLRSAFTKINTNFTNIQNSTFTATKASDILKSSNYTLASTDHANCIVCTAAITITVPSAGTLLAGTWIEILNDTSSSNVTLDGVGTTDVTLLPGEIAIIRVINSKVRISKGLSIDVTT